MKFGSDLKTIKQCNCSICKRKNAKNGNVSKESLSIIKGEEYLTSYKFNTMIAEHFFVGFVVYTLITIGEGSKWCQQVNIGCIDAIDPFEYKADFIDMKNK